MSELCDWVDLERLHRIADEGDVQIAVNTFVNERKELCRELLKLAAEFRKHDRNTAVSQIVGSSVGLAVGLPLSIAAFTLVFVTGGIAAPVVGGIALGVGVASGLTTAGSLIAKGIISKSTENKINEALKRDAENIQTLIKCLEKIDGNSDDEKNEEDIQVEGVTMEPLSNEDAQKQGTATAAKVISHSTAGSAALARTAQFSGTAAEAGSTAFKVFTTSSRVLTVLGFAGSIVGAVADVYILVKSAQELHRESTLSVAIYDIVMEKLALEEDRNELEAFYHNLQQ
ncbi:uncharacterized protein LOC141907906 [Tubulanus polymorphus]|uniref:uncharacterized protein LOC141907906 n=1 Tax=Tubulanus polymorphus TaxID=672921 RepID=UPI003DA3C778